MSRPHNTKQNLRLVAIIKDEDQADPVDPVQEGFSLRKLWAFTGPGFLLSIPYMDPGNIENDLQSGVQAKYKVGYLKRFQSLLLLLMIKLEIKRNEKGTEHRDVYL